MSTQYWTHLDSPIGPLTICVDGDGALTGIDLTGRPGHGTETAERCAEPTRQLEEYFAGQRQVFDLALNLHGSAFQLEVWRALGRIPFGDSTSYGALARALGRPQSARAVGQANGANPIPIVIPCHRVIAGDGRLGGFSGGLKVKRWLLTHESATQAELS